MGPPPAKTPSINRSNENPQTKRSGNTENSEIDSDIERSENEATERREQARNESGDKEEEEEEDPFTDRPRPVNLHTVNKRPSRKRLAEILENPYPNKNPQECNVSGSSTYTRTSHYLL